MNDLVIFFLTCSITMLRKVCNHPASLEEEENEDPKYSVPSCLLEEESTFESQSSKLSVVSNLLNCLRLACIWPFVDSLFDPYFPSQEQRP